jgi:hypothetical protein
MAMATSDDSKDQCIRVRARVQQCHLSCLKALSPHHLRCRQCSAAPTRKTLVTLGIIAASRDSVHTKNSASSNPYVSDKVHPCSTHMLSFFLSNASYEPSNVAPAACEHSLRARHVGAPLRQGNGRNHHMAFSQSSAKSNFGSWLAWNFCATVLRLIRRMPWIAY